MAEGVGELSQASFIGTNLIQEGSLFHDLVTSPSPPLLTRSPWGLEFQYTVNGWGRIQPTWGPLVLFPVFLEEKKNYVLNRVRMESPFLQVFLNSSFVLLSEWYVLKNELYPKKFAIWGSEHTIQRTGDVMELRIWNLYHFVNQ